MRLYTNQPAGTVTQLRHLRRNATEAEKRLRRALKEAFPAFKWRFQAPIGPYRVDFLCFGARLVIEVDGGQHDAVEDAARTRFIESEGYRVLRFWNNDVLENIDGVIATIANSLSHREREGAPQARKGEGR
ncbi:endonuclease domain-containing protein [Sphingomonas sp.]|uniref:endonuclease domain-containing protein n=1 Tax=Sphingomonas sp. TaxID=28214 RepID=UPI002CF093AC|nr:endonuclease domain-containing protein [Sphingomonas sp.]HWK36347.1 endonuclease domain-containing protein [Sphingomonas sp.]